MADSIPKGKDLELAVEAIERAILKASPMYDENTFRLESRKIIVVDGVKHEIDVWVEVEIAKGYDPVFIFECRNREEKVDKNDIIVFSEKIDASRAQRGFFVARHFTKYAKTQAEKDPRIQLLVATELPMDEIPVPFDFHFVALEDPPHSLIVMRVEGSEGSESADVDIGQAEVLLEGQPVDFSKYVQEWTYAATEERNRTFPSGNLPEGDYDLKAHMRRMFGTGELFVDGPPIAYMDLGVEYKLRIIRPRLVSHFEVETRGRSLSLAPVQMGDGVEAQVTFTALDP